MHSHEACLALSISPFAWDTIGWVVCRVYIYEYQFYVYFIVVHDFGRENYLIMICRLVEQ